jgi:hypothetical protein
VHKILLQRQNHGRSQIASGQRVKICSFYNDRTSAILSL